MSIVAWDGKSIAADRMSENVGLAGSCTKLYKINDTILGFTGSLGEGLALIEWAKNGLNPDKYPSFQGTDRWTRLILASKHGVVFYEQACIPIPVNTRFAAWGNGRDLALGAMAHGATAREAVKITSKYNVYCGNGIDEFKLNRIR